jgi:hypothetical protein
MLRTFDFKQVSLTFGAFLIQGFAEGDDVISIAPQADAFNSLAGADGEVTRSKTNDNRWLLTIRLLQTSPSNDDLMGVALADKLSNTGVQPILLKDNNGNTLVGEGQAYIQRLPDAGLGSNVSDREWVIMLPNPDLFIGGNNAG